MGPARVAAWRCVTEGIGRIADQLERLARETRVVAEQGAEPAASEGPPGPHERELEQELEREREQELEHMSFWCSNCKVSSVPQLG